MSDCGCNCPGGNYSCSCCCASVTGLRAGIHPDYIKSISLDLGLDDGSPPEASQVQTFLTEAIIGLPIHIVSVTASLACIKRNQTATSAADKKKQLEEVSTVGEFRYQGITPVMFSLFTVPAWTGDASIDMGGWNAHSTVADGRNYICTGSLNGYNPSWKSPEDLFGYFCDGGVYAELNCASEEQGIRIVVNYIDRAAFSPAYGDPVKVLQHYWSCAHGDREFLEGYYGGGTFYIGGSSLESLTDTNDDSGLSWPSIPGGF